MQRVHRFPCNQPGPACGSKDCGLLGDSSTDPCGLEWMGGQAGGYGSVQRAVVLVLKGHFPQKLAVQLYPTHRQLEEVHFSC